MKMKFFYLVIMQMCITFDDLYAVALVLISTRKIIWVVLVCLSVGLSARQIT